MLGDLLNTELKKLSNQLAALTGLKHEIYLKANAMLVEAGNLTQDQIKGYVAKKRVELASWAGETAPPSV